MRSFCFTSSIGLLAIACGGPKSSPTPIASVAPPSFLSIENFSLENQRALDEAVYPLILSDLVLLDPSSNLTMARKLGDVSCSVTVGVLRNPGGMLYSVRQRSGQPLNSQDRKRISGIALAAGVRILKDGRIPYHFGPDGRTPIIMSIHKQYEPEKYAQIVPMSVELSFKDAQTAKSAMNYIDAKSYATKRKNSKLLVSFKNSRGAATDEEEAFQFLARRFEGKFDWLQSEESVD